MPNNAASGAARDTGSVKFSSVSPRSKAGTARKRICIVSVGSISQNPRVLKEANALAAAHYDVIVVFLQHFGWARALDEKIIKQAKWRAEVIDVSTSAGGRIRRYLTAMQVLLFRMLCRLTLRCPVPELAQSRFCLFLFWRAVRQRSDLYIGHYPGALPAVAWAAWWTESSFAFDFEDFHRGQTKPSALRGLQSTSLAALEKRYLVAASFVTAASWGIAEAVAKVTGIPVPVTVLNVFPWADRTKVPAIAAKPENAALSLYWLSQIVSLDRGLQDVLDAMASMRERAELHIRGRGLNGSIDVLRQLAEQSGIADRVFFHPAVSPDELLADAAIHDIGLCLEVPDTENRDICITNKVFLYMLAGLALVLSRTRGQSAILQAAPDIGRIYESKDSSGLAAILDQYAADRALLVRTKMAALAAARDRWNWELESAKIVDRVGSVLATDARSIVGA